MIRSPDQGQSTHSLRSDNLLSHNQYQGETISAYGNNWPSLHQSSSGAILQGQIIPAPETGRHRHSGQQTTARILERERGAWVAFPPPHITVCSLYIVVVGRLICGSLFLSHCGARAPRVDRTQGRIIEDRSRTRKQR